MVVGEDGRMPLPWLEEPLRQAIGRQRSHALLVQAAAGVGALQFMLTLAQAWLCEADEGSRPCGTCDSCRLVRSRSHPDLRLLLPEAQRHALGWDTAAEPGAEEGGRSRKKPSRQIRIDEVREAIDWVVQTSSRGRAKVMLLHPAESMNPQAANALLKTLEEPPGQARLLLSATDPAWLLPTLRSRCQRIVLGFPGQQQATTWLKEQGVTDAPQLLAAAGGAPLGALELQAAGIDGAAWAALPRAVAAGRCAAFLGWPIPQATQTLQKLCHDAMVLAAGGVPRYFPARSIPAGAGIARLAAWAQSLGRVARHDDHPWNDGLLLEALVSEGHACWQDATPRGIGTGTALDTLVR